MRPQRWKNKTRVSLQTHSGVQRDKNLTDMSVAIGGTANKLNVCFLVQRKSSRV